MSEQNRDLQKVLVKHPEAQLDITQEGENQVAVSVPESAVPISAQKTIEDMPVVAEASDGSHHVTIREDGSEQRVVVHRDAVAKSGSVIVRSTVK
jgi:hypothetical protein